MLPDVCEGGPLLCPAQRAAGDGRGSCRAQHGSLGAGEGAGAGEASGGRAGAPGRAEEAALRPGRNIRRGGGWGGEAGASPQARHPQEAPLGAEARPRGGRVPCGGRCTWRGVFAARVTGVLPHPPSCFSLNETPARTHLAGRTSSSSWFPTQDVAFALVCLHTRGSPHRPACRTGGVFKIHILFLFFFTQFLSVEQGGPCRLPGQRRGARPLLTCCPALLV